MRGRTSARRLTAAKLLGVLAAAAAVAVLAGMQSEDALSGMSRSVFEALGATEEDAVEGTETFTVRVSGTPRLPYEGIYGTAAEGEMRFSDVLGERPVDYEFPVATGALDKRPVSIILKSKGEGRLRLELLEDGRVLASDETCTALGWTTVVYPPPANTRPSQADRGSLWGGGSPAFPKSF